MLPPPNKSGSPARPSAAADQAARGEGGIGAAGFPHGANTGAGAAILVPGCGARGQAWWCPRSFRSRSGYAELDEKCWSETTPVLSHFPADWPMPMTTCLDVRKDSRIVGIVRLFSMMSSRRRSVARFVCVREFTTNAVHRIPGAKLNPPRQDPVPSREPALINEPVRKGHGGEVVNLRAHHMLRRNVSTRSRCGQTIRPLAARASVERELPWGQLDDVSQALRRSRGRASFKIGNSQPGS